MESNDLRYRNGLFIPFTYIGEEWKKIDYKDCKDRYLISIFGRVYNSERGHLMRLKNTSTGYKEVTLSNKYFDKPIICLVHRLVMITFKPVPGWESLHVNHIDGNKINNNINNLEWVTALENVEHAKRTGLVYKGEQVHQSVLTEEQVHIICKGLEQDYKYRYISEVLLGIPYTRNMKGMISSIRTNETWTHISCMYKFPVRQRAGTLFTDEQVHDICLGLQSGLEVDDILDCLFQTYDTLNECDYIKYRRTIFSIRRREIYKKISQNYDF